MTRLLVMPLGETDRAEVEAVVRGQFRDAEVEWFERARLRRNAFAAIAGLRARRFDDAVLVAPELGQRRLRITSLLLTLPRARRKWRVDLRGAREPFSTRSHIARNAWPIVQHAIACALAAVFGEAALRVIVAVFAGPSVATGGRHAGQRVLYLRSQLWLGLQGGGSVAHTAGVISGLQQAGARVHVVSSDALSGVNAPISVAPPETWFDEPLRELEDLAYNVAFLRKASHVAKSFRPTVIYQRHTAFNCAGAVLARILNVPLVLEFNSSEVWKGQYWGGLRRRRAALLVERINLRAANRVIVVSRVLQTQLIRQGVQADKIVVNPNGVDPDRFAPDIDGQDIRRQYGIEPHETVVGFSGTFGLWHGIPTLAATLPMVARVRWLLIGDGPLRHLVEQSRDNVTLTGLIPHDDMAEHLAACDILVSPHGRQADGGEFFGSPTKLYEYMAMGRPIVASAVGQIAEVLEDGSSALLVPPDDPEALCRAINTLIDCPDLRARLGANARTDAVTRHTWLQNARRVLACLEQ